MYTWYEYVEYVFWIWIREVGILDKNTWNLYTRYEYVEYVYLIWMCRIRTMDMNMWNMYNWYDFGYMMNVTVWRKYLLSYARHGQGIEIWYSTCRHVQGMDMNQKCDTVILPFGVCLNDSNLIYMINRYGMAYLIVRYDQLWYDLYDRKKYEHDMICIICWRRRTYMKGISE